MTLLLIGTIALPLVLAMLAATPLRHRLPQLTALAPLPLLVLPFMVGSEVDLPWLLVGLRFGVDSVSVPFIMLTGLIWTAAAIFARSYLDDDPNQSRFYCFFLLTLVGNIGTVLALDPLGFYLFFTVVTFAAYGLIVHDGSGDARRAGRVYLILAIVGELLLLAVIMTVAASFGSIGFDRLPAAMANLPSAPLLSVLILTGFAIKTGLVPLHVWLPLAHPAAPVPASAVLSGILIKLGLLGWLRFLPLGELALPTLAETCLILGTLTIFYGVVAGLPQQRAKTVLAYSSISQMGLVTVLIGIGLSTPDQWPLLLTVLLLFVLHHGLAKAALFLALATGSRWLLVVPALVLAGAPLTSGMLAKLALKAQLVAAPGDWPTWLGVLIPLSSVTTGLLMARLLYLAWPGRTEPVRWHRYLPCAGLILAGLTVPTLWTALYRPELLTGLINLDVLLTALVPLLIAVPVALVGG